MTTATGRAASLRFFRPWQGAIQPPPTGTVGPYQRAIVCAAYLLTSVLAPTGIPSAEAFGTAVVSLSGTQTVSPSSITSAEAFGTSVVSPGPVTVSPSAIVSAEGFGAPVVAGPITATGIPSAEAFGSPVVAGPITVTAIPSAEAFGAAIVTQSEAILPTGIASAEAFGTAALYQGDVLYPGGIPSGEAFGTPTILPGASAIALVGIASLEAFGTPDVRQVVSPGGIATAEAFGTPRIDQAIQPPSIPSGETIGNHAIYDSNSPILVPNGIPSAEAFGTPTIVMPPKPGATLAWSLRYEESGLILTGTCQCGPGVILAAGYGVLDVFASDKNPNQLRFYRSTDDGVTWALATTIAQSRFTYRMYGWDDGTALLGTQNGICRTTDYGVTWSFFLPAGWSYQDPQGFHEPGDGFVYTWYANEFWRSSDKGLTWTLYATMASSSVPQKDGETTWITDFVVGSDGSWLLSTGTNGSTQSSFVDGAPASILRSEDQGVTWDEIILPHTYTQVDPDEGWGPAIVDKTDYWTPPTSSPEAYGYYGFIMYWVLVAIQSEWAVWIPRTGIWEGPFVQPVDGLATWDTGPIITQFARLENFTGVEQIEHLGNGVIAAIGTVPMMDARGVKSPPRTWRSTDNGRGGTWTEVTNQVLHDYDNDHTYQAGALRAYGEADVVSAFSINAFQAAGGLQNIEDEVWTRESHDAGVRYPTTGTYDTPQTYEAIFPTEIILGTQESLVQTLFRPHQTFWVTDVCQYRWKSQIWRALKAAPGKPNRPVPSPCPPAFGPVPCPQECVPGDAETQARSCARMT